MLLGGSLLRRGVSCAPLRSQTPLFRARAAVDPQKMAKRQLFMCLSVRKRAEARIHKQGAQRTKRKDKKSVRCIPE
jgi:hypothetical protein